jgi:putative glutamine amidotransferase
MSVKPCIGVTSSLGGGRYMWWFYWLSLRLMGARPVRLVAPRDKVDLDLFDGLVIGGGDDIGAELYKGETTLDIRVDTARDTLELDLLRRSRPRGMPVLGVCRGAQMLNISQNGTLHQDIYRLHPAMPKLRTPLPRKTVHLIEGTRLAKLMGREKMRVNSLHHQAVDRLGDGLVVAARDEFGLVQAIEEPGARFRMGVQWHPEFLIYRARHRRLFQALVEAARAFAATRRGREAVTA